MQITAITVKYEETCSLPNYSNVKPSVSYTAVIEEGDDPQQIRETLLGLAKQQVRREIDLALEMNNASPKYCDEPLFVIFSDSQLKIVTIWPAGEGDPDYKIGGVWYNMHADPQRRERAEQRARAWAKQHHPYRYFDPADPELLQILAEAAVEKSIEGNPGPDEDGFEDDEDQEDEDN